MLGAAWCANMRARSFERKLHALLSAFYRRLLLYLECPLDSVSRTTSSIVFFTVKLRRPHVECSYYCVVLVLKLIRGADHIKYDITCA